MIEEYQRPRYFSDNGESPPEDGRGCPACRRIDAMVKASAVVRASKGRLLLEDGTSAAYESDLSALLSRPPRPQPLSLGVIVTALIAGWLLLALDLVAVGVLRAQDQVSIPPAALDTAMYLGLAWFGVLIPGVAVARYFLRRESVKRALPAWREASQRWQAFHYCSRDDLVFVPGEGHGVAPEHMALLYRAVPERPLVALKAREVQA